MAAEVVTHICNPGTLEPKTCSGPASLGKSIVESKVPHTVRGLVSSGTQKAIEHKLCKRRGDL